MKCDKSREITAYLKGEVPEAERGPLRDHFEQCSACAQDLARFDRVLRALGKMDGVDPSPGFKWRVREAFLRAHPEFLERPLREPLSWWQGLRGSFGYVPAWALSIAAHVLLIATAAILIFVPKSPDEELESAAIGAKPRRAGDAPDFAGDPSGRPRAEGLGRLAPDEPRTDFTPGRRGGDPEVPLRPIVRSAGAGKMDLRMWKDRIPAERRLLAFFSGRGLESQRDELRAAYGGKGTEKAIRAALDWLARAQQPDGRWTGPAVRAEQGGEFTYGVGLTGLALMAFLAEGHAGRTGDYAVPVRKGLEYLLGEQRASGLFGPPEGNYMYSHALAALAVLEASMMTRDEALATAASAAVNFTVAAQNETGGWGYTSRSPANDTSVSAWQILLLRLAKLNGNQGVITSLVQAYERVQLLTDAEGKVGYQARLQFPNGYLALTAAGMLSHQMATHTPDPELLARQAAVLLERSAIAATEPLGFRMNDLYFAYFGSLAMHQHDREAWGKWYGPLADKLARTQGPDGSWPADFDRWHSYGGQVYTTAMAALILETPVRYPRLSE